MSTRGRSQASTPPPAPTAVREAAEEPTRGPFLRLAYGVVITWIVGWFAFLLVRGICPVP